VLPGWNTAIETSPRVACHFTTYFLRCQLHPFAEERELEQRRICYTSTDTGYLVESGQLWQQRNGLQVCMRALTTAFLLTTTPHAGDSSRHILTDST
jgi:hypothetical protein